MINANKANDLGLINKFKAGDASAFEGIILKYQDRILTSAGIYSAMPRTQKMPLKTLSLRHIAI